jgi:peptide/nickel transport system substrate-binding protein
MRSTPNAQRPTRKEGRLRACSVLGVGSWRLGVCLVALLTSACRSQQPAADPNIITIAARVGPNNLHPLKANDEGTARVGQLMYDSLMDNGQDLRAQPRLAERIEMPDPRTYVVHLRRGVRFHDGHELTSRDVVFTFSRFLDPAFLSPFKGAFTVMAGVRALDDYTVAFSLKTPFPSFPVTNLVPIPIIPDGVDEQSLARTPNGTGPYRLVRYAADDKVELKAFDGYWNGPPRNAGVVFKVIPDDTMRGLEMRKGTADLIVNDVPPDIVYQMQKSGDFRIVRSPGLDFSYLGFNMRDPVVADKRVRQAIGYATNRDAIVKYLRRDLAHPATGLLPPQAWAYEPDIFTFTFDPEKAKQLLDEAGYRDPDGSGPLPRLRLTLKISTNEEVRLQSTVIQQDLRRVGIELDVRTSEFATVFADIQKGNFQIMSLQWVGGAVIDPDILRRVFHSAQIPPAGYNRGHYRNPEVDRLIDRASAAIDEGERKTFYGAAQRIIAEDAVYIPIWNRVNVAVAQNNLDGLRLSPSIDFSMLKDVYRR